MHRTAPQACSTSAHLHELEDDALLSPRVSARGARIIDDGVLDEAVAAQCILCACAR